ncbi:MAG: DUF3943 domain-containing protein [Bacteroidota bacterium]|nr:DUF3943 domain-containing protein [Bacteroidota bacterium]
MMVKGVLKITLFVLLFSCLTIGRAEEVSFYDTDSNAVLIKGNDFLSDSIPQEIIRKEEPTSNLCKSLWISTAEVVGINVFVNSFDRFILDAEFARVSFHSIQHNIENGFVWDYDKFSTNLFFHPYHGGLYFNAARSNGLNFWQSAPFSLFGSFMWEVAGEVEPPSINDIFATTLGGIAIGEITHRLSNLVIDESSYGWERFFREFFVTAICPIKGLNRILRGEAWQHKTSLYKYHDFEFIPVDFSLSGGWRYLADKGSLVRGESNPFVIARVDYGDVYNTAINKPYDYFSAQINLSLSANQPLISEVHFVGRLYGLDINTNTSVKSQVGFFQHFNYYDSEPVIDGLTQVPYRISEAASLGVGLIYSIKDLGNLSMLSQQIYANGVLLGGSISDYFNNIDRDYNLASGFAVHLRTNVEFSRYGRFLLNADYYKLWTWKGIETIKHPENKDPLYLNVQGNKSNASLMVVSPSIEMTLQEHLDFILSTSYYFRLTEYDYYKNIESNTFELKIGLKYNI